MYSNVAPCPHRTIVRHHNFGLVYVRVRSRKTSSMPTTDGRMISLSPFPASSMRARLHTNCENANGYGAEQTDNVIKFLSFYCNLERKACSAHLLCWSTQWRIKDNTVEKRGTVGYCNTALLLHESHSDNITSFRKLKRRTK